jgi:hypothetical protein
MKCGPDYGLRTNSLDAVEVDFSQIRGLNRQQKLAIESPFSIFTIFTHVKKCLVMHNE